MSMPRAERWQVGTIYDVVIDGGLFQDTFRGRLIWAQDRAQPDAPGTVTTWMVFATGKHRTVASEEVLSVTEVDEAG